MKRILGRTSLVAVLSALALVASAARLDEGEAQPPGDDTQRRMEALEAGQKEILKQLQEIKQLLQQNRPTAPVAPTPPPLPTEPISLEGAATRGNANARFAVVEFSDFECPFCGRYARETFDQLDRDYVATGKIRYVFRNYPIEKLHPKAFKAAVSAECALQQGKFWELHDRLFANQQALGDLDLLNHAKAVGMDGNAFQTCVTGSVAAKVRQGLEDGARAGITGTPMFFIGVVEKDGRLKALRRVAGAAPYAAFKSAIDAVLASPDSPK